MFLPYLCYLLAFIILSSNVAGDYLKKLRKYGEADKAAHLKEFGDLVSYTTRAYYEDPIDIVVCISLSMFCFYMLYVTTKEEIKSCFSNPRFYFTDPWNYVDCSIFFLVNLFLLTLNICVVNG